MRISNSSALLFDLQIAADAQGDTDQNAKREILEKMRRSWIDFLSNFPEDLSELEKTEEPEEDVRQSSEEGF